MHRALQLLGTGQLQAQVDTRRLAVAGLHAGITDVDSSIGEPHQDVFENADAIDHFDAQLRREALLPSRQGWIPAYRQSPFTWNRLHIGAVLTMHGDAMVAECNGAENQLTGQGTATPTKAVVEPLHTKDWILLISTDARSACFRLLHQLAGNVFVAEWWLLDGGLQTNLLSEAVEHLMEGDGSEAEGSE